MTTNTTEKYGKLTFIKELPERTKHRAIVWECVCDCGKTMQANKIDILRGFTKSCGCLHREAAQRRAVPHGRGTKEYAAWLGMNGRCNNPNVESYPLYGGRGIKLCSKWRNSYTDFLTDVGFAPTSKHSLDRINTNGNYEPGNVRWATDYEQTRNKRTNTIITINGIAMCLTDWCHKYDIKVSTVCNRVAKMGWTYEEAITTPLMRIY